MGGGAAASDNEASAAQTPQVDLEKSEQELRAWNTVRCELSQLEDFFAQGGDALDYTFSSPISVSSLLRGPSTVDLQDPEKPMGGPPAGEEAKLSVLADNSVGINTAQLGVEPSQLVDDVEQEIIVEPTRLVNEKDAQGLKFEKSPPSIEPIQHMNKDKQNLNVETSQHVDKDPQKSNVESTQLDVENNARDSIVGSSEPSAEPTKAVNEKDAQESGVTKLADTDQVVVAGDLEQEHAAQLENVEVSNMRKEEEGGVLDAVDELDSGRNRDAKADLREVSKRPISEEGSPSHAQRKETNEVELVPVPGDLVLQNQSTESAAAAGEAVQVGGGQVASMNIAEVNLALSEANSNRAADAPAVDESGKKADGHQSSISNHLPDGQSDALPPTPLPPSAPPPAALERNVDDQFALPKTCSAVDSSTERVPQLAHSPLDTSVAATPDSASHQGGPAASSVSASETGTENDRTPECLAGVRVKLVLAETSPSEEGSPPLGNVRSRDSSAIAGKHIPVEDKVMSQENTAIEHPVMLAGRPTESPRASLQETAPAGEALPPVGKLAEEPRTSPQNLPAGRPTGGPMTSLQEVVPAGRPTGVPRTSHQEIALASRPTGGPRTSPQEAAPASRATGGPRISHQEAAPAGGAYGTLTGASVQAGSRNTVRHGAGASATGLGSSQKGGVVLPWEKDKDPSAHAEAERRKSEITAGARKAHEDCVLEEAELIMTSRKLRSEGLRKPRGPEPSRNRTHWDYVLEEMAWMANDFAQEKLWKLAAAAQIGRWVAADVSLRAKIGEPTELQQKDVARSIANLIGEFWKKAATDVAEVRPEVPREEEAKNVETNSGREPASGTAASEFTNCAEQEGLAPENQSAVPLEETKEKLEASEKNGAASKPMKSGTKQVELYATRLLKALEEGNLAEPPPTPDRRKETSSLDSLWEEMSGEPLTLAVPLGALEAYRLAVELRWGYLDVEHERRMADHQDAVANIEAHLSPPELPIGALSAADARARIGRNGENGTPEKGGLPEREPDLGQDDEDSRTYNQFAPAADLGSARVSKRKRNARDFHGLKQPRDSGTMARPMDGGLGQNPEQASFPVPAEVIENPSKVQDVDANEPVRTHPGVAGGITKRQRTSTSRVPRAPALLSMNIALEPLATGPTSGQSGLGDRARRPMSLVDGGDAAENEDPRGRPRTKKPRTGSDSLPGERRFGDDGSGRRDLKFEQKDRNDGLREQLERRRSGGRASDSAGYGGKSFDALEDAPFMDGEGTPRSKRPRAERELRDGEGEEAEAGPPAGELERMGMPGRPRKSSTLQRQRKPYGVAHPNNQPVGTPWSELEDNALLVLGPEYAFNWLLITDVVASQLRLHGIRRTPGQCRERYTSLMQMKRSGEKGDLGEEALRRGPFSHARGSRLELHHLLKDDSYKSYVSKIIELVEIEKAAKKVADAKESAPSTASHPSHKIAYKACSNSGIFPTPMELIDRTPAPFDPSQLPGPQSPSHPALGIPGTDLAGATGLALPAGARPGQQMPGHLNPAAVAQREKQMRPAYMQASPDPRGHFPPGRHRFEQPQVGSPTQPLMSGESPALSAHMGRLPPGVEPSGVSGLSEGVAANPGLPRSGSVSQLSGSAAQPGASGNSVAATGRRNISPREWMSMFQRGDELQRRQIAFHVRSLYQKNLMDQQTYNLLMGMFEKIQPLLQQQLQQQAPAALGQTQMDANQAARARLLEQQCRERAAQAAQQKVQMQQQIGAAGQHQRAQQAKQAKQLPPPQQQQQQAGGQAAQQVLRRPSGGPARGAASGAMQQQPGQGGVLMQPALAPGHIGALSAGQAGAQSGGGRLPQGGVAAQIPAKPSGVAAAATTGQAAGQLQRRPQAQVQKRQQIRQPPPPGGAAAGKLPSQTASVLIPGQQQQGKLPGSAVSPGMGPSTYQIPPSVGATAAPAGSSQGSAMAAVMGAGTASASSQWKPTQPMSPMSSGLYNLSRGGQAVASGGAGAALSSPSGPPASGAGPTSQAPGPLLPSAGGGAGQAKATVGAGRGVGATQPGMQRGGGLAAPGGHQVALQGASQRQAQMQAAHAAAFAAQRASSVSPALPSSAPTTCPQGSGAS